MNGSSNRVFRKREQKKLNKNESWGSNFQIKKVEVD
jgi:hypothetical protein